MKNYSADWKTLSDQDNQNSSCRPTTFNTLLSSWLQKVKIFLFNSEFKWWRKVNVVFTLWPSKYKGQLLMLSQLHIFEFFERIVRNYAFYFGKIIHFDQLKKSLLLWWFYKNRYNILSCTIVHHRTRANVNTCLIPVCPLDCAVHSKWCTIRPRGIH